MNLTRKQLIFIVVVFIFTFLVSLVITMPASQAYKWGLYPEELKLSGVSGNYLSGRSRYMTLDGMVVSDVSWRWQSSALFLGKIAFEWQSGDDGFMGKGTVSLNMLGQTTLTDTNIILELEKLKPIYPIGNEAIGRLKIDLSKALLNQNLKPISFQLQATTGLVTINTVLAEINLQDVKLDISSQGGEEIVVRLTAIKTPDEMNVLAEINPNDIRLSGYIYTSSKNAINLNDVLPIFAKKQGNRWVISWQGSITEF